MLAILKISLASAELLFGISFEKNETVLSVVVRRDVNDH